VETAEGKADDLSIGAPRLPDDSLLGSSDT
jgi:hypothetical protein